MNKFYGILMQFTNGTTPCRNHLLRQYPATLIDEAVQLAYIVEIRKNNWGDPVYTITYSGRNIRDK